MIVSKAVSRGIATFQVVSAVFIIATLNKVPARPQSSIIRERHIIRAPINFRVIHHYKIKKVPILIKKHLHYHHKPYSEKIRPILEEIHTDHGYRHDGKEMSDYAGIYLKDDSKVSVPHDEGKGYSFHVQQQQQQQQQYHSSLENYHDSQEEEYDEVEDSPENYDDYE